MSLPSTPYQLRGGIRAYYVKGRIPPWIIDYTWFRVNERPGEFFTFEQMDSLSTLGVIKGDSSVQWVAYRTELAAAGLEDMKAKAYSGRPGQPPARLVEAVRRSDQGTHQ